MSLNLPVLKATYQPGQLFRHMDGGFYQFEKSVLFADDQEELVIYQHLWPFENSQWARRYKEFKERFTPITDDEFNEVKTRNREDLKQEIETTRNNRRNSIKII